MFALLALLTASPLAAAPFVNPEMRAPRVSAYDEAAQRLKLREWGATEQSDRIVHVLLRLDARRAVVTIGLPPKTATATGEAWLQQLADGMGWSSVDLYSNPQPGALFLRASVAGMVRSRGFGRSHVSLDLQRLRTSLARISSQPVMLAVRFQGAEVQQVQPQPLAPTPPQGSILFYQWDRVAPPLAPLVLDYGISHRWLAAALTTLLLWLVFPFAALVVSRNSLQRGNGPDPKARLQTYRRWQRGIQIAVNFGAIGTLFLLGFDKFGYLVGPGGGVGVASLFLLPIMSLPLPGRLIGLPLEREAWPQHRDRPWYRMASAELIVTCLGICLFVGMTVSVVRVGPGRFLSGFLLPTLITLPVLGAVGAMAWTFFRIRRQNRSKDRIPDQDARRSY